MKKILLFLILIFPVFAYSQTAQDTVNVTPFDSLTAVSRSTIDTSDQVLIYDSQTNSFAFRGTIGELLRVIDTSFVATQYYVDDNEVTLLDLLAAADYTADGGDTYDFKVINADQLVLNANQTIQFSSDNSNVSLLATLGTLRMQATSYRMINVDRASATESDSLIGLLGITSLNDSVELFQFSDLMFNFIGDSVLLDTSYIAVKEYVDKRDSTVQIYLVGALNGDEIVATAINSIHASNPRIKTYEVLCFNNTTDSILTVTIPDLSDSSYVFNQVKVNVKYIKNFNGGSDGLEILIENDSSFYGPEGYVSTDTLTAGQYASFQGFVSGGGPDRLIFQEKPFGGSSGGGTTTIAGYGAISRGDTIDVDTVIIADKDFVNSEINQVRNDFSQAASSDLDFRFVPVGTLNGRKIYASGSVDPSEANLAMMQHAEDELIVPTYDGVQNIAHPAMEYIDTSWNGYKYWLAFTPYPAENRENPSIAYSNDGITWDTTGLSNPVVPPGDTAAGNYNSDVDLLFRADQSKMYLFWRYTDGIADKFYAHSSTDGTTWSDSTLLLTLTGTSWLSPTYQYIKGDWHTWYVDGADSSNSILYYRRADELTGLSSATQQACTYNYTPSGKHLWHIQVWNDPTEDQLCAIFNFTDIPGPGGAPNTQGTLHYATSTDGKTWDVQTSPMLVDLEGNSNSGKFESLVYRSTLRPSDYATENGAAFEVVYNAGWNLGRSMIWLQPRAAKTTQIADTISNINALYSFFVRDSSWHGLPVARVSVRDTLRDVFSDGSGGLQLADSTALETWAGSDTAKLVRWYNQKLVNDYLRFINYPDLLQDPWTGSTGKWYAAFDAADTIYAETMRGNLSVEGVTLVADIETGRPFSVKSGVSYFGMNSGKLYLLTGANVNTDIQPRPGVFSGIFGGSARIRKNGTNLKTGSTSSPSDTEYQVIGSFWSTTDYNHAQAFTGKISEVWMYNTDIGNTELSIIENQLNTDYAYQIDTLIYDTFTDSDGTDLKTGGHAPDQSPGDSTTWYQSSTGWTINSNKLQKTGAGDEYAVIDAGSADGILRLSASNLTTELSGAIFRWQDFNDYWFVRLQGTTVYLIRVTAGAFNTEATSTITDINGSFDVVIELNGSKIMVYVDGVLEITHTGTEYQTETVHGIRGSSADDNSFYDNFVFEAW